MIVRSIAALLGLVAIALFARRLGSDGYGEFAFVIAVAAIVFGPPLQSIAATLAGKVSDTGGTDATATIAAVLFAAIAVLLLFAVVSHVLGGQRLYVAAGVLAAALSLLDLARRHAAVRGAAQRVGAMRVGFAGLVCAGAWLLHGDADPVLAVGVVCSGAVIAALAIGAPAWRAVLYGRLTAGHLSMLRASAPPIALIAFGAALLHGVDRLFLAAHVSQSDLGIYASAVDLSHLFFVALTSLLYVMWLPRLTSARIAATAVPGQKQERALIDMRYALAAMTLLLPALIAFILMRVELTAAVFGGAYAAQANLLPWIGIAAVLGALRSTVLDASLYREGRLRALLRNVAISAFVNVALNALYVPRHGVMAAIAAALVSQSLAFFLAWRASRDVVAWRIPRVQFERIVFCCGAMAFVVLLLPRELLFVAKVGIAAFVYAVVLLLVNGAGFREWLGARVRRMD